MTQCDQRSSAKKCLSVIPPTGQARRGEGRDGERERERGTEGGRESETKRERKRERENLSKNTHTASSDFLQPSSTFFSLLRPSP